MARLLLVMALAGLLCLLAVLALYGVVGPRPTPPGLVIVPPARPHEIIRPHKDGGPLHVLLVGTSLTARGDWPERLERALASCAPQGVVVERLAKSGQGIRWGLPALQTRLSDVAKPRPDITIVEFSGNDASLRQGLPLFLARKWTLLVIETLDTAGSVVFLSTMNPGWGSDAITRPGQARYHGMYRDVAAEAGAGLIDTAPQWRALAQEIRTRVVPDGGHPNEEGAELITIPAFLAALRPLVCG
ncbi:MAG: SGNH/GDSL hydrolase family protein [Microgenomates group bacterium]